MINLCYVQLYVLYMILCTFIRTYGLVSTHNIKGSRQIVQSETSRKYYGKCTVCTSYIEGITPVSYQIIPLAEENGSNFSSFFHSLTNKKSHIQVMNFKYSFSLIQNYHLPYCTVKLKR